MLELEPELELDPDEVPVDEPVLEEELELVEPFTQKPTPGPKDLFCCVKSSYWFEVMYEERAVPP